MARRNSLGDARSRIASTSATRGVSGGDAATTGTLCASACLIHGESEDDALREPDGRFDRFVFGPLLMLCSVVDGGRTDKGDPSAHAHASMCTLCGETSPTLMHSKAG
jgi:hypothetical protein